MKDIKQKKDRADDECRKLVRTWKELQIYIANSKISLASNESIEDSLKEIKVVDCIIGCILNEYKTKSNYEWWEFTKHQTDERISNGIILKRL